MQAYRFHSMSDATASPSEQHPSPSDTGADHGEAAAIGNPFAAATAAAAPAEAAVEEEDSRSCQTLVRFCTSLKRKS